MKYIPHFFIVSILALFAIYCRNDCFPCIYDAIKIIMVDSSQTHTLIGFTVKATDQDGNTYLAKDSSAGNWYEDSSYRIGSTSGIYKIEIAHPFYDSIIIDSIRVESDKCGPITRFFKLIPGKQSQLYKKVQDTIHHGCS